MYLVLCIRDDVWHLAIKGVATLGTYRYQPLEGHFEFL